MPEPVYVIGAARTDFKRNLKKEGKSLRHVIVEAGGAAIADAGLEPSDVQSGIVGNFAAGLYTHQLHLGALLTEIDPALRGIPTFHTEAACASGSVAVLAGVQQIMAGVHDVVLVVGAEQQKTMSPSEGSDVLGAAGDYATERVQYGEFMFPKLFGRIAELYGERYGLTEEQLAKVAVKNFSHAAKNPCAQMRTVALTVDQALQECDANPRIAPPLKITDCSQISDGAAGVILCSERFLQSRAGIRSRVRLLGFGHTTDYLLLERKYVPEFPMARRAAWLAYQMAGVRPDDIQAAEIHDCFTISEIVGYELLGLADRGQGAALLESGATALPWARERMGVSTPRRSIPVNTGGGLIGDGHPVGATGVRQITEAYRQLTQTAGDRQVENVQRYLTFNMGGSMTTSVAMVWGT